MWLALFVTAIHGALCPVPVIDQEDKAETTPVQQELPSWRMWNRMHWRAEEMFDDEQTQALCAAIESDDLPLIRQLVERGADVNNRGRGNVTPLLWGLDFWIGKSFETFETLLAAGADPNIRITEQFANSTGGRIEVILPGVSVTHLVCQSRHSKFFEAVFRHGGDPNLTRPGTNATPMSYALRGARNMLEEERLQRIGRLIEFGADLDAAAEFGQTPAMYACSENYYSCVNLLLDAGADPFCYDDLGQQLIHYVARSATFVRESRATAEAGLKYPDQQFSQIDRNSGIDFRQINLDTLRFCDQYDSLVERLSDHGFSLREAEDDLKLSRAHYEKGDDTYFEVRRKKRQAAGLDKSPAQTSKPKSPVER